MKEQISRRAFAGALGAGVSVLSLNRTALAAKGPNDQVVLGMIGAGGQGTGRLKEFLNLDDVRIGAICDVDRNHLDRALGIVDSAKGYKPQSFGDFRKVLDLKEIDAVAVVTPDHWHAIPTVAAFEAGKDVFVEKRRSVSTRMRHAA